MALKLKGREALKIDEGKHKGTVTKVELATRGEKGGEQYEYVDIFVQLEGVKAELKYSCPADITVNTKLGKTLMNFGVSEDDIESGEELDVEAKLKGKKIVCLTQNETSPRGTFARISSVNLPNAKENGKSCCAFSTISIPWNLSINEAEGGYPFSSDELRVDGSLKPA